MGYKNCAVFQCLSNSRVNKDIKFHHFPPDARRPLWIAACRRPELKDKTSDQLRNTYICSLHFVQWMYGKQHLKNTAIPIVKLPSASTESRVTQTELDFEIQKSIDSTLVPNNVVIQVAIEPSAGNCESQTMTDLTDRTTKKRRFQKVLKTSATQVMKNGQGCGMTFNNFIQGCDKYLSPNLREVAKLQAKLKYKRLGRI